MQSNRISNVFKSRCVFEHSHFQKYWSFTGMLLGCKISSCPSDDSVQASKLAARSSTALQRFHCLLYLTYLTSEDHLQPLKAPEGLQWKGTLFSLAFQSFIQSLFKWQSCFVLQTLRWQAGNLEGRRVKPHATPVVELPEYPTSSSADHSAHSGFASGCCTFTPLELYLQILD